MSAGIQVNIRMSEELHGKLQRLAKRWGCTAANVIRITVTHLDRREDIASPLDIEREIGGAVDALMRIRNVCDKALKQAEKERRELR